MRSEFEFLANLKNRFNLSAIGDDCAVLPWNSKYDQIITADVLHEDIDFRVSWTDAKAIGYKCLAVSLSDIASMAGTPQFALITLSVPERLWKSDFVDKFYEGFCGLANEYGVTLIGGDISSSNSGLVVDVFLLGNVEKDCAILRSGAQVGDSVYVSGRLGLAAAGLELLESGQPISESQEMFTNKLFYPQPRISKARELLELGGVTSMIDLSDGLSSELNHICRESKVGARIIASKIPTPASLMDYSNCKEKSLELALHGGEDFELLFTVSPSLRDSAQLSDCFEIGQITNEKGSIQIQYNGSYRELESNGWSHF